MAARSIAERVEALLPDLYALRPFERFPREIVSLVRLAIGGDKGEYTELDLRSGDFRVVVHPEPAVLRDLVDARRAHMHDHPVLRYLLDRREPQPRLISDFVSAREFRRTGLYGDFFREIGVEDQISMLVSAPFARVLAGVSIDRGARTFSPADRRLLAALRPHLVVARTNAIRYSRALAGPPAGPDGSALARLTDRQREVLASVAQGLTNDQIALTLGISPGTVRKHVEHVLHQLGVSTRTGAAALYLRRSSAASPPWTAAISKLVPA